MEVIKLSNLPVMYIGSDISTPCTKSVRFCCVKGCAGFCPTEFKMGIIINVKGQALDAWHKKGKCVWKKASEVTHENHVTCTGEVSIKLDD